MQHNKRKLTIVDKISKIIKQEDRLPGRYRRIANEANHRNVRFFLQYHRLLRSQKCTWCETYPIFNSLSQNPFIDIGNRVAELQKTMDFLIIRDVIGICISYVIFDLNHPCLNALCQQCYEDHVSPIVLVFSPFVP